MQYLAEQRIRIPEDFGVVGFDDVYFASLPQIQMTTIAQPRNQMGVLAAEILIRHIESGDNEEEHILLQPELIIRNSTRKPLR
jgi:LacI family transcriptional regulator